MNDDKLTLDIREASRRLGLSRNSTYRGVKTGEIPSIRVGKRLLVPVKALEQMLASGYNSTMERGQNANTER